MLVFLDFDGVLHPVQARSDDHFCRRQLLEDWLRQRPDVEVVVSSTWRVHRSLDELRGLFSEEFQPRLIGVTPQFLQLDFSSSGGEVPPVRFKREFEIRAWLRRSTKPWRPWVALDDMHGIFSPFCANLVVVDPNTGLVEATLEEADRILGLSTIGVGAGRQGAGSA